MKNIIQSLKGTRDFYPETMAVRTWLYNKIRQVSESFGYQEYEGPFLESIELYAAKSGEELVKEQSFVFPDRSGDLITLRPELTPTLVRMVAQRQGKLTFPLRWWSFGPFWRYERPQKGRTREFFQWNIDLIGIATPEGDAELAAVMATFFQSVGLSPGEAIVYVNNRRLMDGKINELDIPPEMHPNVFRLIDRREKLKPEAWEKMALDQGLTHQQLDSLKNLLANHDLWQESDELVRFFQAIEALGVKDYVRFEPQVIRGLDYYTGTVYEAQAISPDIRRSIAGGGRYDNLLADVGGDPLPGTGYAMGDVVISLLLEKYDCIPDDLDISPASVFVTIFDQASIMDSLALTSELRQAQIKVACYPLPEKMSKQFKYADRIGARLAVVLGPDEIAENKVSIKDLHSREQYSVPRDEVVLSLQQMLAGNSPP
jgi:histidyl-tRNA synthetase